MCGFNSFSWGAFRLIVISCFSRWTSASAWIDQQPSQAPDLRTVTVRCRLAPRDPLQSNLAAPPEHPTRDGRVLTLMVNVPFIRLRLGTAGPFHRRATARTKMSAESEVATASQSSILPWWGRGLNPALTVRREPFPATPMGQVAMTVLSLLGAGERTGTSKVDIWRAIQVGTLSAKKTDDGGFAIDPSDLFAVFETKQVDQRPMAEDAAASVEASESPETSATPETVETELKGLPVLPAEAPIGDDRVRTGIRCRGSTWLNGMLNSPNRPLSEQKSKRWLTMLRCRMNSPGGRGSSDGSGRAVAGQPGSGSEKGYRG
jgi:hypothetical protein